MNIEPVTSEQIKKMTVRLKYLTHDARDVITRSNLRDDLVLWQQIQLISLCSNYATSAVLGLLAPSQQAVDRRVEQSDAPATFHNVMTLGEALSWRVREHGSGASAHLATKVRGRSHLVKRIRDILFTPKVMLHLYIIDSRLLTADWTVRMEVLVSNLDRITTGTLEEILGECNYPRMSAVLADLEAFFGSVEETRQMLANAPEIEIIPATKVDPKVVEQFQEQIRLFEDMEKEGT
jgi:hypothetical protein